MRRLLLCVLVLAAAGPAWARKAYYVNKGVKYHIGDDRYSRSEDALFMQGTGAVGPRWEQSFKVDRPDRVQVRIEHIWGVDDCPYCKVIISIDGKPMARLFAENNRTAFTTPDPLAVPVEPGRTHVLAIESVGGDTVDDFVIQDVVVETAEANVELLPGPVIRAQTQAEQEPVEPPPPPVPACGQLQALRGWLGAPGRVLAGANGRAFGSLPLQAGQGAGVDLRIQQVADLDAVSQAVELRVGGEGWALNLAPGAERVVHADELGPQGHRARRWNAGGWKPGQWNRLQVQRCRDGQCQLYLNGQAVGRSRKIAESSPLLSVKLLGLQADLRELGGE